MDGLVDESDDVNILDYFIMEDDMDDDKERYLYTYLAHGPTREIEKIITKNEMEYYIENMQAIVKIEKLSHDNTVILLYDMNYQCTAEEYIDGYENADQHNQYLLSKFDKEIMRKFNDGG
jgi:hypothetical protein